MKMSEAVQRIKELEEQVETLRKVKNKDVNPVYQEMLTHLMESPKSISELAEIMVRENRTISQWLHALKTRYGANIITLADGKKSLTNPELFQHGLPEQKISS